MSMAVAKIILSIYAVLMAAGGIMGYMKAASKMSLIMGIVSSVVIFFGIFLMRSNPQAGWGTITVMTLLLCVSFTTRFLKTHQFMPSGMLLIFSIAALVISLSQLLKK